MQKEKSTKKWLYVGIIVLIVVGFFVIDIYTKKEKTGIDSIVVKKSDIIQKVSVTGNVKSVDNVNLGFDISGRVSSVNVSVGNNVIKGQYLVQLDNRDLKAQLLVAQSNLAEQQANLAKLKIGTRVEEINIEKVRVENAKVTLSNAKKSVVNILRDSYSKSDDAIRNKTDQLFNNPGGTNPKLNVVVSNNQLEANVEAGRLSVGQVLKVWKNDLEKLTVDSDLTSSISKTENNLYKIRNFLDNVASVVNSLTSNSSVPQTIIDGYKANIWTARSNINIAITNITTVQEKLRSAQSSLVLVQNELALKEAGATKEDIIAQEARVQSAQASIKSVNAKLAKAILYSPITGVVTKVNVKVGEIVPMNTPLVSVISNNVSEIEANVAETDIEKVSVGDSADVTLDAYGDNVIFKAVVTKIDPADIIIEGVPTYKTTFRLISNGNSVKPGMTANIDISTKENKNVIAIPDRAVKINGGAKFVRVLGDSGKISKVKVKTGLRGFDGRIEILSGLKTGDRVIIFMP